MQISFALVHQYQWDIKTIQHAGNTLEYIEVELGDIEIANRLANEVLGRTLDELPPQTRKLLSLIQAWVLAECDRRSMSQRDCRFSRREVREVTRWSDTALKVHIARLVTRADLHVDLSVLAVRQGKGKKERFVPVSERAMGWVLRYVAEARADFAI